MDPTEFESFWFWSKYKPKRSNWQWKSLFFVWIYFEKCGMSSDWHDTENNRWILSIKKDSFVLIDREFLSFSLIPLWSTSYDWTHWILTILIEFITLVNEQRERFKIFSFLIEVKIEIDFSWPSEEIETCFRSFLFFSWQRSTEMRARLCSCLTGWLCLLSKQSILIWSSYEN